MPCSQKLESSLDLEGRFQSKKGITPEEEKGREKDRLQLSCKWIEGYGQGDENKLCVEDWRNYGISAHF